MTTRLLILGGGLMARNHVSRFRDVEGVEIVGVADLNQAAADGFAQSHHIPNAFASLESALDWSQFDAVANVTPDGAHYPTTMQVIAAGKHILCEKPLATNAVHAREMADAAKAAGLVNMVNLTYREVPAMRHAAKMVRDGAIGRLKYFESSYLQSWLTQAAWGDWRSEPGWLWRLSTAHGSKGVLGDIGVHILDFATYVVGASISEISCQLKTFDKTAAPGREEYVLDANDTALMMVSLDNGATGTVNCTRFASGHLNDLFLRVHGDEGGLEIRYVGGVSHLRHCAQPDLENPNWREVPTDDVATNYAEFVGAIREGRSATPGFDRGAEIQAALDAAEQSDNKDGMRLKVN